MSCGNLYYDLIWTTEISQQKDISQREITDKKFMVLNKIDMALKYNNYEQCYVLKNDDDIKLLTKEELNSIDYYHRIVGKRHRHLMRKMIEEPSENVIKIIEEIMKNNS